MYKNRFDKLKEKQEIKDANKLAHDNIELIDKPRKPINRSFIAPFDFDECPRCLLRISKGERVRYTIDNELVHVKHALPASPVDTICTKCFLTKPCECD